MWRQVWSSSNDHQGDMPYSNAYLQIIHIILLAQIGHLELATNYVVIASLCACNIKPKEAITSANIDRDLDNLFCHIGHVSNFSIGRWIVGV